MDLDLSDTEDVAIYSEALDRLFGSLGGLYETTRTKDFISIGLKFPEIEDSWTKNDYYM